MPVQPLEDADMDPVFDYCKERVLIIGCGNPLFGDDGFGPAVIKELEGRPGLEGIYLLDAGTSARNVLFNIMLSEKVPDAIVIIDSIGKGKGPGKVFELGMDDLSIEKSDDFQFHFVPAGNMLRQIRDEKGVRVIIIACEAVSIPKETMHMGLSDEVRASIPVAAELAVKRASDILAGR